MAELQNAIALDQISNLILTAPTKETYHATVAWFEHLGLKPIMTESSSDATATWLQLFSSSASIHDVSLKVVLSPSAIRKLANSSKMDWRSLPAIATITTGTLKVIKKNRNRWSQSIIAPTKHGKSMNFLCVLSVYFFWVPFFLGGHFLSPFDLFWLFDFSHSTGSVLHGGDVT